jgi:predicted N-acetyltransferase YhbS
MGIEGPRACRKDELKSALDLTRRVFRAGWTSTLQDDYPLLLSEDNLSGLRVFSDGGRVVSLVGTLQREIVLLGPRHRACLIGGVCTEPDYRGQGLATRLMDDAQAKALEAGCDVLLISGSRGLYQRLGFVNVGGYTVYTVERGSVPKGRGYSLRAWALEDLPALTRIHAAEPVRFVRTPGDFLTFLKTGKVTDVKGELRVICRRGGREPIAYVAHQLGGRAWEKKPENAVTVAELAGPRWAVAHGLGLLMEERSLTELTMHCADCDAEMAQLAASFRWAAEPRGFRGTVGIIAPQRFFQACEPFFRERLGAERAAQLSFEADGAGVRVRWGEEQVALKGMGDVTNLVFLPLHRRGELELGLAPGSELGAVLDELFPLPLVEYGLDYA